ncbi:hypothetical protein FGO68_gene9591 [Halteria grandinella]|uniref:Uncharacterized protein n=1 Tax=Halteria grandinella TaxID=5974 RepID=A0A8J8T4I7_HALGN|nr:hypothetical protein FGO68_gene9591 [Halteria grandinella]
MFKLINQGSLVAILIVNDSQSTPSVTNVFDVFSQAYVTPSVPVNYQTRFDHQLSSVFNSSRGSCTPLKKLTKLSFETSTWLLMNPFRVSTSQKSMFMSFEQKSETDVLLTLNTQKMPSPFAPRKQLDEGSYTRYLKGVFLVSWYLP